MTGQADKLRGIANLCDTLTGPDRNVDVAIACLMIDPRYELSKRPGKRPGWVTMRNAGGGTSNYLAGEFTAKLDAAICLFRHFDLEIPTLIPSNPARCAAMALRLAAGRHTAGAGA